MVIVEKYKGKGKCYFCRTSGAKFVKYSLTSINREYKGTQSQSIHPICNRCFESMTESLFAEIADNNKENMELRYHNLRDSWNEYKQYNGIVSEEEGL